MEPTQPQTIPQPTQSSPRGLMPVGELFKKSFEMYKKQFWVFAELACINLLVFLALIPVVGILGILFFAAHRNITAGLLLLCVFLAAVAVVIAVAWWARTAVLYVIKDRDSNPTAKAMLKKSWPMLGSYSWVYVLVALALLVGFVVFIIPGIIFMVWFVFAGYVFLWEGKKGTQALMASKELVKGYWWAIFGRLLLIMLIACIISLLQLLGTLINL